MEDEDLIRLMFLITKYEIDPLKKIIADVKDKRQIVEVFKKRYLRNIEETLKKLENSNISDQELINSILQIETLDRGKLINSLHLRLKIFEKDSAAIQLMTSFITDRSITYDTLK